jgi:translocator protein
MDLWVFLLFLLACSGSAASGAMFPPAPWYRRIDKPRWTPPDWVFPVVWTTLYVLMSWAAARVAAVEGSGTALALWAGQLTLGTLWSPVFFGLGRFRAAMAILGAYWLLVATTMVAFFAHDLWAGLMFVPYLVWVSTAAALNFEVMRRNPDQAPVIA